MSSSENKKSTNNLDDEQRSLAETRHLLSSPKNAERLLMALQSARRNEGQTMSVDELRRLVGLGKEE